MPCLRFHDVPIPLSAVYDAEKSQLTVTFDRPLQSGALEGSNWTWRFAGTLYDAAGAEADGTMVLLDGSPTGFEPGADVVNYSPPPFDVVSAGGEPAAAFSDFPVI